MQTYIYNETPSWDINWINKVFTVINDIERIEELYIWWVAYRDLTFNLNTITLNDAPPIGATISVDYFQTNLDPITPNWDVTLGQIIDDVYEKIWEDRLNNRIYPESQVKLNINAGIKRIKNLRTYKDRILSYSFNNSKTLTAKGYSATWVTIWEYDNVPSNWVALLDSGAIFSYNTYVEWKLNWTVWFEYKSGSKVSLWYKIPNGVKKVSEVLYNWVALEYKDIREFTVNTLQYTVYSDISGDRYIILPYVNNWVITVKYIPNYNTFSADEDIVPIEYEYFELLSYYALYMLFQIREDDRWQLMDRNYRELLREYKSYKSRAVDGINNRFKSNILTNF